MRRASVELWVALWVVYLVWGSTYLGIKLAVRTLPPLLTGGTRFLAAAVVLAGILTVARRSLRASRREVLSAAGLGVVSSPAASASSTWRRRGSTRASRR